MTGEWGKDVFDVGNILSVYTDGRKQDIPAFVEERTDGLGDIEMAIESNYSVNISTSRKKRVYTEMQSTVFCMPMVPKSINSKQRTLKWNHIHCVWETFQNTLQLITWKNWIE